MVGNVKKSTENQSHNVIVPESAPGLRRRFTPTDHIFGNGRFSDLDSKLQQFAAALK
jgi:hypothetical protein